MKKLQDLKDQVKALGLEVKQSGPRPAKLDYIKVLRDHYLKRDFPSDLPYSELSPMLCFTYWDLKAREQNEIWKDSGWILQEKLNGCRLIIHFVKGLGIFAHSRTISEETYRRTELTDHLVFGSFIPDFTATIDSELAGPSLRQITAILHTTPAESLRLQKEVPLTVHAFDITSWQGTDLRTKPLRERLVSLAKFEKAIAPTQLSQHFAFPAVIHKEKQQAFEKILEEGKEGCVLKRLGSTYEDARSRRGWVKLKKQLVFDAYVSGFLPGKTGSKLEQKVASLDFSVRTEDGHRLIARISNLDWQFRKEISETDPSTGKAKLRIDVYGRVARISGLEMSAKAFRLSHPKIVEWRDDLKQEDCFYSAKDLQSLREGCVFQPMRKAPTTKD